MNTKKPILIACGLGLSFGVTSPNTQPRHPDNPKSPIQFWRFDKIIDVLMHDKEVLIDIKTSDNTEILWNPISGLKIKKIQVKI